MIDSHAHLSSPTLRGEIEQILSRAQKAGLNSIVNICTDPEELAHGLSLTERFPWVKLAGATTPHDVEKEGESAFASFERAAREGKLVAVGETGLDYFYEYSPREIQQHFLRRYIALALETKLPLVIHCREAFQDLFRIFDEEFGKSWAPGLLHCFTGTQEEAEHLVEKGWMVSFSGIITYKKSAPLRQIASSLPIESLLVETDAPFLAPQSHRGEQNEPAYIIETATLLAELKGIDLDLFSQILRKNAERLFHF